MGASVFKPIDTSMSIDWQVSKKPWLSRVNRIIVNLALSIRENHRETFVLCLALVTESPEKNLKKNLKLISVSIRNASFEAIGTV